MIHGENKKFPLDYELSQKNREIKNWSDKRKSIFLGRREKNKSHGFSESPSFFYKTPEGEHNNANLFQPSNFMFPL